VVEECSLEVRDLVDGVETVGDSDLEVDEFVFSLLPGSELVVGDCGDGVLDPSFRVVTQAGDDAAGKGRLIVVVVGLDGLSGLGALSLDEFEGELEEVVPDVEPLGLAYRALDRVRFEDPEMVRTPIGGCRGFGGVKVATGS
jgi:hypothetical protein